MGASCSLSAEAKAERRRIQHDLLVYKPTFDGLGMSASEGAVLYQHFTKIDVDGSGEISMDEMLRGLDIPRTKFSERVFNMMDEDGSGEIDFREFLAAVYAFCSLDKSGLILFAFSLYDTNSSDDIDEEEMTNLIHEVYGTGWEANKLAVQIIDKVHRWWARMNENAAKPVEVIDMQQFAAFTSSHPALLFPAFRLQTTVREVVCGERFWRRMAARKTASNQSWVSVRDFREFMAECNADALKSFLDTELEEYNKALALHKSLPSVHPMPVPPGQTAAPGLEAEHAVRGVAPEHDIALASAQAQRGGVRNRGELKPALKYKETAEEAIRAGKGKSLLASFGKSRTASRGRGFGAAPRRDGAVGGATGGDGATATAGAATGSGGTGASGGGGVKFAATSEILEYVPDAGGQRGIAPSRGIKPETSQAKYLNDTKAGKLGVAPRVGLVPSRAHGGGVKAHGERAAGASLMSLQSMTSEDADGELDGAPVVAARVTPPRTRGKLARAAGGASPRTQARTTSTRLATGRGPPSSDAAGASVQLKAAQQAWAASSPAVIGRGGGAPGPVAGSGRAGVARAAASQRGFKTRVTARAVTGAVAELPGTPGAGKGASPPQLRRKASLRKR